MTIFYFSDIRRDFPINLFNVLCRIYTGDKSLICVEEEDGKISLWDQKSMKSEVRL